MTKQPAVTDLDLPNLVLAQRDAVPPGIDSRRYHNAVDYSAKRYAVGLARYEELLKRIGFLGGHRALDVGSGAGHWCVALAQHTEEVLGIERAPEYVEVARLVSQAMGLSNRVQFQVAPAEDIELPAEHFDLICCHSVLMFTDHERVAHNVSTWAGPDARFYCGYTSWPSRVAVALQSLIAGNAGPARTQLTILINDALFRCGIGLTPGSAVRCFTREELVELFEIYGFTYLESPGVQDGPRSLLGHRRTFDLVCRKTGAEPGAERLGGTPGSSAWLAALRRLIDLGAPRRALKALSTIDLTDPHAVELLLRARLKLGQPLGAEATRLEDLPAPGRDILHALDGFVRSDLSAAREACTALPESHPDRRFLLASALASSNRVTEAREVLLDGYPPDENLVREWALLTFADIDLGDLAAARAHAEPLVHYLARTGGAPPAERDALLDQLRLSAR